MSALRHPQWEQRLHAVVEANLDRPYAWGQHDCLIFPANVVKAVTGKDHARGHRGKYNSLATAYRHLQEMGFTSPAALLDSLFERKPVGFAQRGDLVLCKTESGDNPGVCMGDFALVVGQQGEREGLIRVPRALWLEAWAVGDHHSTYRQPRKRKRP
jgi:hypothetical protein